MSAPPLVDAGGGGGAGQGFFDAAVEQSVPADDEAVEAVGAAAFVAEVSVGGKAALAPVLGAYG